MAHPMRSPPGDGLVGTVPALLSRAIRDSESDPIWIRAGGRAFGTFRVSPPVALRMLVPNTVTPARRQVVPRCVGTRFGRKAIVVEACRNKEVRPWRVSRPATWTTKCKLVCECGRRATAAPLLDGLGCRVVRLNAAEFVGSMPCVWVSPQWCRHLFVQQEQVLQTVPF